MAAAELNRLRRVHVVDLSDALLAVARRRIRGRGWSHVETVRADATTWRPASGAADAVTLSYALTMIPDWFRAVDNAWAMLRPGGVIGVVDFYVSRRHPAPGRARHGWTPRTLWPIRRDVDLPAMLAMARVIARVTHSQGTRLPRRIIAA